MSEISKAAARDGSPGFLSQICSTLLEFVECDAVEILLRTGDELERCGRTRLARGSKSDGRLTAALVQQYLAAAEPPATLQWNGSWRVSNGTAPSARLLRSLERVLAPHWKAALLVPLDLGNDRGGLLALKYKRRVRFSSTHMRLVEATAQVFGLVFTNLIVDSARRERVKELACLHAIAQLRTHRNLTTDEQLERIVGVLPPAWQYPDLAAARIEIDGKRFCTRSPQESAPRLSADIQVKGQKRGVVEVLYDTQVPLAEEGPFLEEEGRLLDTVAKEIALMLERKSAEDEEAKMLAQLHHADRLATIGQLSAGVAHEINEPLSSILGFTQLIRKEPCLPEQAQQDLLKIEKAALQAREVVQNLLLFARQMPIHKGPIELNRVVQDALTLLRPRLDGHEVTLALEPALPPIVGDSTRLHQVVVNLVTNAVQAMPGRGRLALRTFAESRSVCLVVEDTGSGMSDEIAGQVFLPFFTTKDVGEGTGLGLSVVHGIVAHHGGSIEVTSEPGVGSRFEVRFPLPRETGG